MKRKGKLASVLNRSTVATLLAVMMIVSSFSAIAVSADLFASGGRKKDIAPSGADSVISYESGKVYFLNTANWSKPHCYAWKSSDTSQNNGWPGKEMTDTGKTYSGSKIYECAVDSKYDKVIFNVGSSSQQTGNLDKTENAVFVYSGNTWEDLKAPPVDLGDFDYYAENAFPETGIYAVNASYFDYLSDAERSAGWLKPIQAGTGFNGSADNWYPFKSFNSEISSLAASNSTWEYPLYFGNFCNTGRAEMISNHNGPYSSCKSVTRWDYFPNNSNSLGGYHYAVRGLAMDSMKDNNIRVGNYASSINMPYFDASWLGNKAKKIKSYFPFRISSVKAKDGVTDVTQYEFKSNYGTDNVYFTWNSDGSPKSVKYGAGTEYGILDGYRYFMNSADKDIYDDEDKYGIFPFNNAKESSGRKGNSNLDYGFGIKLDIDFRVPVGGLLAGDTPVTFEYGGDDDLWVYLTDDTGKSKLVLDLGGNHKLTEGKLDFSTMKATSTYTSEIKDLSGSKDIIQIHDGTRYMDGAYRWDCVYLYASDDSGNKAWYQMGYDEKTRNYYATKDQYPVRVAAGGKSKEQLPLSRMKRFQMCEGMDFNATRIYDEGKTARKIDYRSYTFGSDFKWGDAKELTRNNTDNPSDNFYLKDYSGSKISKAPYFTSITEDFSFDGAGTTLDPNRTYHMTVFYMERGTLESNFKVAFTMLPVTSEFELDKTVNVDAVNTAVQSEVQSLDDFDFEIKSGSSAESVTQIGTKDYTHTRGSVKTQKKTSMGKLSLKDNESAYFNGQLDSGKYIEVTESSASELLYTTKWVLTDKISSTVTNSTGTDNKTSSFKMGKANSYTDYSLSYENTPKVGDLEVSKKLNKAGADPVDDEFTVKIEVDLDGDGTKYSYSTYALDCEKYDSSDTLYPGVTKLNADGTIKLKEDERVVVSNLPVGAKYKVTEINIPSGFTAQSPAGIEAGVEGTVALTPSSVKITNKKSEGSATLDVIKMLDQAAYNSSDYGSKPLFSFTLTEMNADGTVKAGGATETTNKAVSGQVTFKPFKYTSAGTYYYKITESNISGRASDYKMDAKAVFAKVEVKDSAAGFDISTGYCKSDASKAPNTLSYDNKSESKTFDNITYGQLKVTKANKLDAKGNAVPGTELKGAKFELRDGKDNVIASVITDSSGVAEFKNLPIKDSDGNFITYTVKEVKAPAGYLISDKAKKTFTFEGAQNAAGTYTRSYAFVNLELTQPDSGEVFGSDHLFIGGLFMLLSAMSGMAYLLVIRKRPRAGKSSAKHK